MITHEKAALETDGRYFNQASRQLEDNWILLKKGLKDVPTWQEWTAQQAEGGKVVGVDPTTITASDARKLLANIKKHGGSDLVLRYSDLMHVSYHAPNARAGSRAGYSPACSPIAD